MPGSPGITGFLTILGCSHFPSIPQYTPYIHPEISWTLAELIFGVSQFYRDGRLSLAELIVGGRQNQPGGAQLVYAFITA